MDATWARKPTVNALEERDRKVEAKESNRKYYPKIYNRLLTHALLTVRRFPRNHVYATALRQHGTPLSTAPMDVICTHQSTHAASGQAQAYDG